jgi:23S rRNA pseudouridine2457 synthase
VPSRNLIFYKPFKVLSQFTQGLTTPASGEGRLTLADFIKEPGVYPVGRLDYDSEGLMLLTDDGALQYRLSDPRFAHRRTYWVQVEGCVTEAALQQLAMGVTIGSYRTQPADARAIEEPDIAPRDPPIRVRKSIPTSWLELTITEGRNRQVRRMTAAVGFPTLRLTRIAIGDLRLHGLMPGQSRHLSPAEVKVLQRFRR